MRLYLQDDPGSRVLVSAQSNQAVDNIGRKLVSTLPQGTLILREMPRSGDLGRVDPRIRPYILPEQIQRLVRDIRAKVRRRISGADDEGGPLADAEYQILDRWLRIIQSNQIELAGRLRMAAGVVLASCSIAATILDDARDPDGVFDWVIVEEAAKAWPTEVIIPLVLGTRWTLVGDHRQLGAHRGEEVGRFLEDLRHVTDERVRQHADLRENHLRRLNLFGSLFEAAPAPNGSAALGRLNTQFRMHRDIAQPISRAFYPQFDRTEPEHWISTACPGAF